MRKKILGILLVMTMAFGMTLPVMAGDHAEQKADTAAADTKKDTANQEAESHAAAIDYRYLSKDECADTLGGLDEYYEKLNQKSLDYFMQKKGATVKEDIEYSKEQALDFTKEEKAFLDEVIEDVEEKMEAADMKLPEKRSISIALTTMQEAGGAGGYTHGTTVFLNKVFVDQCLADPSEYGEKMQAILAHELFHCLTRNNPEFRKDMYSIINFTVTDSDYDIPDDVYQQIIFNPDVAHHDSYAEFTIDGKKKKCYLVFLTKDHFEKTGDTFFTGMYSGLVDIESGTLYASDEASDFYDVMGKNTEYCEDPEECMATDFSYAVTYGMDGPDGSGYPSPEIIEKIISYLQKR